MVATETMAEAYQREKTTFNGYDAEPAEKPTSIRDELRSLYLAQSSMQKMDDELSERITQLVERIARIERTIGE